MFLVRPIPVKLQVSENYLFYSCFLPSLEMLSIDRWAQMKDLVDSNLKRLSLGRPSTVLQYKPTSTTRNYLGGFKRWKQWVTEHKILVLPDDACHFALYLKHLGESKKSKSAVEEVVNCLLCVHSVAGVAPPNSDPLVQVTLGRLKRMCAKPVQKRLPSPLR